MSGLWLLFSSLSVIGSLFYNLGVRFGTQNANAFKFTVVLSLAALIVQTINFIVAKFIFKIDMGGSMSSKDITFAVLAGLGAGMIDLSFFLANRYGSLAQTQIFWTVGSMVLLTIVSAIFFKDIITPIRALGILFGIGSVVLISRS